MEIDNLLADIIIQPAEELDQALERVIAVFEAKQIKTYKPDYLNSLINAKDFTRVFNVYQNEIKHSFFIITSTWDIEKVNQLLNSFSQPNEKSLVYFLSAYPLPEILAFINKNTASAFFELEVIRNFKSISKLSENSALITDYSTLLNKLSQKYFNTEINYEVPQCLKNIEKVLINHFRNGDEYEPIQEVKLDYFPYYSLALFGLFIAELMIKNFKGELFYNSENDLKELGVGFSLKNNEYIDLMAHPLDKVFNFFFHGKDSSIINWYYDLKYFFNNPDSVRR